MIKKILKLIKQHDDIVIARHIGPDPDAVASQIALREAIKLTYPNKKVYAVGAKVARFKYLGILDRIDENVLVKPLLIVVDNPNIYRLDSVNFDKYDKCIVIDHHPKEDLFEKCDVSYVDETASSASQLVADILMSSKLKMNSDIAGKLFVGIVADSDRFLLNYTNYKTFGTVSKLMEKYPLELSVLYSKLYERPLSEVRFQGYIASNLVVSENGFGYIKLDPEVIRKMDVNVDVSSASNMVNDFNFTKELFVWAFSTYDEKSKLFKVNIRSRGPIINEVASRYNGGGHKLASGARIENVQDVDALFRDLDQTCKEYKESMKDDN